MQRLKEAVEQSLQIFTLDHHQSYLLFSLHIKKFFHLVSTYDKKTPHK